NRLLGGKWDDTNLSSNISLITLDHTFSCQLVQAAADRLNPLRQVYDVLAAQDPFSEKETFGRCSYIGMHAVFLAVDRFFATLQFEEALQLARLVFDPTIDIEGTTSKGPEGSSSQSCWRFPPFLEMANEIAQSGNSTVDLKKLTEEM
ncbi:toxin subunit, partial [Fusarium pseudoanthophilum]